MNSKKFLSKLTALGLCLSLTNPMTVKAINNEKNNINDKNQPLVKSEDNFRDTIKSNEKKVVKPLVVLMDFPNYKYTDIKKKERYSKLKFNDYSKEHYENMLFKDDHYIGPNGKNLYTMKGFYKEQSGETYIAEGDVYGWYTAKENIEFYGKKVKKEDGQEENDVNVTSLVKEAVEKLALDSNIDLSKYDLEDVYDRDGDGNYNEPDGIIDHLIIVYAGIGEATGGGSLDDNAIWAHRASIGKDPYEITCANGNKIKISNYLIQPQDSGTGVFCHEYAHDLGLPDEYDTSNTGGNDPIMYWSLMSKGPYAGEISETEPVGLSPWAKIYLQKHIGGNWLNEENVNIEDISKNGKEFTLNQASIKGNNKDALIIDLPNKETIVNKPTSGEFEYFSGNGDELDNFITYSLELTGTKSAKLNFKAWYNIEEGWDFASVQVREKGTTEWKTLKGNIVTEKRNENSIFKGEYGITGNSNGWIDAEFKLDKYAGKSVELMFKYETDPANLKEANGIYLDDILVQGENGQVVLKDNVEVESLAKLKGFTKVTGKLSTRQYYIAEWRTHNGVDVGLANTEKGISYDPGLLLWYVDEYYGNNNWVSLHPGQGFIGIVDADQNPIEEKFLDTQKHRGYASGDYQLHDATFNLTKGTDSKVEDSEFNKLTVDDKIEANSIFDDSKDYTNKDSSPQSGLILPKLGLKVKVVSTSEDKNTVNIKLYRDNEDVDTNESCFKIENLTDKNAFRTGNDANIKINVTNGTKEDKTAVLILGIFDKDDKMIDIKTLGQEKKIKPSEIIQLNTNLKLDSEEFKTVKVFLWDNLEDMNSIMKSEEYNIQK